MRFWKLLTAVLAVFVPVTLSVSSCSTSAITQKQHANDQLSLKKHQRGEVPYMVHWGACLVSVIPIVGDAKYIIDFPNTLKKLQFVNVYESPKDLYLALKSFPFVHGECWPTPSSNPATKPQQSANPQSSPRQAPQSSPQQTLQSSPQQTLQSSSQGTPQQTSQSTSPQPISITSVFATDSNGNKQVNFTCGDNGQLAAQLYNPSSASIQATVRLVIWAPNVTVNPYDNSENINVASGSSTLYQPLTFAWWVSGQYYYTFTIQSAAGTENAQTNLNFTCPIYSSPSSS